MANLVLRIRPDAKQSIRVGDLVKYQAFIAQSDGLSSEVDVTEKVSWLGAEGSQSISSLGIADKSFVVRGVNAGTFKLSASMTLDESALESNSVEGVVIAEAAPNQVCEYGPWSDDPCSKPCGGGVRSSRRSVTVQPPSLLCDETSKSAACNMETCASEAKPVLCRVAVDKPEVDLGKSITATVEQTPDDPTSSFEIKAGDQSAKTKSFSFAPIASGKITATVINAGGSATCVPAEIKVKIPEAVPLPSCNLVADKMRLPHGGGEISVTVQRTNVAPIDYYFINTMEGSSQKIKITETTTVRGSVGNAAGSVACAPVTIEVLPPPPPAPTCSLVADKIVLPVGGSDVRLTVNVSGAAEKVVIDGKDGSSSIINVKASRLIEASVSNQSGTNTCNAAVTVSEPPTTPLSCVLSLSPKSLSSGGGAVTASITVSGDSAQASINGVQGKTLSETISASKSYLGKVSDSSGNSAICSASVEVAAPQFPPPTCTLTADKIKLPATGGDVTLKLNVSGKMDSSSIDGVAGSSLTRKISTSKQVSAVVSGPGGSGTCSVYIEVAPPAFCVHGSGGRVIFISTSEDDADRCRDEANSSRFAHPNGVNCDGESSWKVSTSRCDQLGQHAVWKHRSVVDAGQCVRFNPLKCYQRAQYYKVP